MIAKFQIFASLIFLRIQDIELHWNAVFFQMFLCDMAFNIGDDKAVKSTKSY